jgi:hypothetical protein
VGAADRSGDTLGHSTRYRGRNPGGLSWSLDAFNFVDGGLVTGSLGRVASAGGAAVNTAAVNADVGAATLDAVTPFETVAYRLPAGRNPS